MASDPEENNEEESDTEEEIGVPRFGVEARDTLEKSKQKQEPLREKDFIHNEISTNPSPLLIWLLVLAVLMAFLWGARSWYTETIGEKIGTDPFLQVTNRDFSLFLWQNPEFMRINQKRKSGYLPAFEYLGDVSLNPKLADKYALAPPEVVFRYHVWNRLVRREFSSTPIPLKEFQIFINDAEEWKPKYWADAPKGYAEFINNLPNQREQDLKNVPESRLPKVVKLAFQGWRNYYEQGEAINDLRPSYGQVKAFLQSHPNYARHNWGNVLMDSRPNYLKSFAKGGYRTDSIVPDEELSPFLKVALFNYQASQK